MINKLVCLFRNRPSSSEEAQLEDALRSEGSRICSKQEEDNLAVANIVKQARRRPKIRGNLPASPWASAAPGLLAAAAVVALLLIVMRAWNQPTPEESPSLEATQTSPAGETFFAEPVRTLVEPFAVFAFNPLAPVTDEWNRFAGDARENIESLLATAKALATLPAPSLSIDPEYLFPTLPELQRFSPYGN
ncbi:MAG: hypothetical protein VCA36_13590, partial [Opitutales bacterium]